MDFSALSTRLSELSQKSFAPLPQPADWPLELDASGWCMPLELCAVKATGCLDCESVEKQKRLAFFELINFFSLNIHGERFLLGGLGENLYGPYAEPGWDYLHHFIDEENKHLQYFASFCLRYAGKIYPNKKVVFQREHAPGEASFLFFAKVLIFEEVVDYFNQLMARDATVLPIVRQINRMHHQDEVRHLAFGRAVTSSLFQKWSPRWSAETLASVVAYLERYFDAVLREYTNPLVYCDAGLVGSEPGALRRANELARNAFAAALPLRRRATRRARSFFAELNLAIPEAK